MSWQQVAEPHVGHRTVLKAIHELRCCDCAVTLVIHREGPPTGVTHPKWKAPDLSQVASPEIIAKAKRDAAAAIEHARLRRTAAPEVTS